MKLIDADALANNITIVCKKNKESIDDWLRNYIEDEITDAPTIDAEPIRHGKWNRNKIVYMECSECGWLFEYYGGLEKEWNYCPHCGCKMDKVNDEN